MRFTQAFTPNAKCSPSRAIVLTGRNTWQLGAAANHFPYYPAGLRTFMEALGTHGYATGFTGKGWAPGDPGLINGQPRLLTGPGFQTLLCLPPTPAMSNVDYAANFEAFLDSRPKDEPFCFWYGGHDPHRPYTPGSGISVGKKSPTDITAVPPYWPDTPTVRGDMLDYSLAVEYYDRQLGEILAILKKKGLLANTLVVATSDNGMPFPRIKGTAYEASVHMPLAMMWPAGIRGTGRVVRDYVSFIDFAPTFLEITGVTAGAGGMDPIQGKSLTPIFRRATDQSIEPGRDSLIIGQERHDLGRPHDEGYPIRGIFSGGYLYLHNFEPTRWPMGDPITGYLNTDASPTKSLVLDNNRHDLNHWMWALDFGRRPADELYALKTDADCMNNLAGDPAYAARCDAMQKQLFAELRKQDDPRVEGRGQVFDNYPFDSPQRDFYTRFVDHHEKMSAAWATDSDFEAPTFDPERPDQSATAAAAQVIRREDAPEGK